MGREVLGFEGEENLGGWLRGRLGVAVVVVRLGGRRGARPEDGGLIGVVPTIGPYWFRVLHDVDSKPESREARSQFEAIRKRLVALKPEAVDFRSHYAEADSRRENQLDSSILHAREKD